MSKVKYSGETEAETAVRNLMFLVAKAIGVLWLINKLPNLKLKPQYHIRQDLYVKDRIDIKEFDKSIRYISRLQTVSQSKCDRHRNKVKNATGILPVANLCKACQKELKLDRQVYDL